MGKQKSVTIRMSNYQYEKLQREAEQAGYNNLSEYLRNRLSKKDENAYVEKNYRCNLCGRTKFAPTIFIELNNCLH